ncbi:MAG: SDR family oxidoreductase [Bacteroidota bacterium]
MKVLILGSEGFIGKHLVNYYSQKKYQVFGCDIIETPEKKEYSYQKISLLSSDFSSLFINKKFDLCINASGSGNVSFSMQHPLSDFEANLQTVIHVLENIKNHNSNCKFIHISSAAVYGNPSSLPVSESAELKPLSPYGWHKYMSELLCVEYAQIYNLNTASVRPFSVFGPGLKKQLLWDISQKINSSTGEIELWGTGKESRDFIFISDLVDAIDIISEKGNLNGEQYNLASSVETTVEYIAKKMVSCLNETIKIKFNNKVRAGDPLNWKADLTKVKSLGFTNKMGIDAGIENYCNWIKSNN